MSKALKNMNINSDHLWQSLMAMAEISTRE